MVVPVSIKILIIIKLLVETCNFKVMWCYFYLFAVETQIFYLIHCNYYCKTDDGVYVPAELAISKFSLGSGIIDSYHTLISPGI